MLGTGEVEEEALIVGVQVGHAGGRHDVVSEPIDLVVGEGLVEGDEAAHGLSGVEGEDAEGGW